ncbi:MAG: hypothetical protein PWP23_1131 [Candidatus Sumerlaeota bacterium]|nr:hypothetical protein [Candidatus Sumerlaeota bacterium]
MTGTKQTQSIAFKVLARIRGHRKGSVFTPADFADLGSATAVHLALMRHQRTGRIRRLARGLYDFPRTHPQLGTLAPAPDAVAKALQARDGCRLQPTGAHAANLLGLSTQVPTRIAYLTDGPSRLVRIGRQEIQLKRRNSRVMATAGRPSGLVIQALSHLGRDAVDQQVLDTLTSRFSPKELASMGEDARYAPAWIADILRQLAARAGEVTTQEAQTGPMND